MKKLFFISVILLMTIVSCRGTIKTASNLPSREVDFNFDWKFKELKDTLTLKHLPLKDAAWRDIRLPHDWSVEHSFKENLEGATGYLPGGVGVYQKHFTTDVDAKEKSVYVLFDGVYNNATFWLNGKRLGENPYGYSPTYFDLTPYLKEKGQENVITVYVDRSRYVDSRWYTGSGIYRNVKLVTVDRLHIPIWGTFVTTPEITKEQAKVDINITVANQNLTKNTFTITTNILDPKGNQVATASSDGSLGKEKEQVFKQSLEVKEPYLWDIDRPQIYKAITTIVKEGTVVDSYETKFGIRSLRHDKEQGFFLNGKSTYVKGVCLHHDAGLVGAAVPKGVWRRRLQALKDGGVNAIRTSHNPFSEEFYDLCDEMGFLVQAEIFDEFDNPKDKRLNKWDRHSDYISRGYTEYFQKWAESDLKRTMLRDRNHPSIFEWSIGNEVEWTYEHYKHVSGLWDPGTRGYWNRLPDLTAKEMQERYKNLPDRKYKLAKTAERLARWTREMDTTRPVTANLIIPVASLASGFAQALDVVGFSYQVKQYDWSKNNYPDLHFTGNENSGTWEEWNSIIENPMVYSMYMWTGINYMGEANKKWPQKGWKGDMLDFAGFKVQGWDYFKSIWKDEPHIALGTYAIKDSLYKIDKLSGQLKPSKPSALKWNTSRASKSWNYPKDKMIIVEVPTNLPTAELFLNGKSYGRRTLSKHPDHILKWAIPFEKGTITAKSTFNGKEYVTNLITDEAVSEIKVTTDKTKLKADGYDVAHIIAQLYDTNGNEVYSKEQEFTFTIEGDVKVLGVDNGWVNSTQDYQTNKVVTHNGHAMLLLQSLKGKSQKATIKVSSKGLETQEIVVDIIP